MKSNFFIAFLMLIQFTNSHLNAQNFGSIAGQLTDSNNQGLDIALVSILNPMDSNIVKSEYSDVDGSFEISKIKPGKYLISITHLGFEPLFVKDVEVLGNNEIKDLGALKMQVLANTLKEVNVTAKVPYIERKIDRTIVNVESLIANDGSNALEALERAPGISTDNNGNLKLKGRGGVQVYVDDKPTYMAGNELEAFLKNLPANSVKQIEIMSNPPAKYEAAGNSGIINIVLKRNRTKGLNGTVSTGLTQGRYTRSNNSINLNYNTNKTSIYGNLSGGIQNSFQDLNINRFYKNADLSPLSSFSQNSFIEKQNRSINGKIGVDWFISDHTTIGTSIKSMTAPGEEFTDNKAVILNQLNQLQNRVNADNRQDKSFENQTYNAYWKRLLGAKGANIVFDADYVSYSSNNAQIFKNTIFDNNNTLTFEDQINGDINSKIDIYALKSDYTTPINASTKFEAGLKFAYTKTDNEAAYFNTINEITSPDYNLSNRFLYDEYINAAYVNLSKQIGPVGLQAGLRAENTSLTGNQLGNPLKPSSQFERSYTNLFPTVFASWNVDSLGHNSLSFSYGRRIDRPFFQDLNPFISPLDKFTFYSGNPNLLPTFSNILSLTHSFKGMINTSINYSNTIDGINETLEIKDGIYFSRPGNIANSSTLSLSVEAGIPIQKWYSLNSYLEYGNLAYESPLYTETLNSNGNYYFLSATNSFVLGKGWNADIRADYQSDIVAAQLKIKSFGTLNFGIQKKFLKNKASVKLNFNDILYTRRADGIINNLQLTDANWDSRLDTRSVSLSFSYKFGKILNNDKLKHIGAGSASEQQRVKS